MQTVQSQIRKWGRSLGIVIPKEAVSKENLKEGEKIEIIVLKRTNALEKTFGKVKTMRSTEEIMKEIKEEAWDE